jgi:hypothetical protein
MSDSELGNSRALWNRCRLDLRSDETLAQLLDRGEMSVWRTLYAMARDDASLRGRIARIVQTIPTPMPHFWLAALTSLGEPIDLTTRVPAYDAGSI